MILHCLIMAHKQRLLNILSKAAPLMEGQREARKRETADVQIEKKDEHFKIINYASYNFVVKKL